MEIDDFIFRRERTNYFPQENSHSRLPQIFKYSAITLGVILFVLLCTDVLCTLLYNIKDIYNESHSVNEKWQKSPRELREYERHLQTEDTFYQMSAEVNDTNNEEEEPEKENPDEHLENPEMIDQITDFFKGINNTQFEGTWESQENIQGFQELSGEIDLKVEIDSNPKKNKSSIHVRFIDGHYADRWVHFFSKTPFNPFLINTTHFIDQDTITFETNLFMISGAFFEVFEQKTSCREQFNLQIVKRNQSEVSEMKGSISDSCGTVTKFSLQARQDEDSSENYKVAFYSLSLTILVSLQISNTMWITNKVNNNNSYSNTISLLTVGQSIIWNAYGCLGHFYLSVLHGVYLIFN
jgi:hypothetical protein